MDLFNRGTGDGRIVAAARIIELEKMAPWLNFNRNLEV